MKYANQLKFLLCIGKCCKCLYYVKKALCLCALFVSLFIGIGLLSKSCCGAKALKGLM